MMETLMEIERELLVKELRAGYWEKYGFIPSIEELVEEASHELSVGV